MPSPSNAARTRRWVLLGVSGCWRQPAIPLPSYCIGQSLWPATAVRQARLACVRVGPLEFPGGPGGLLGDWGLVRPGWAEGRPGRSGGPLFAGSGVAAGFAHQRRPGLGAASVSTAPSMRPGPGGVPLWRKLGGQLNGACWCRAARTQRRFPEVPRLDLAAPCREAQRRRGLERIAALRTVLLSFSQARLECKGVRSMAQVGARVRIVATGGIERASEVALNFDVGSKHIFKKRAFPRPQ